NRCHKPGDGDIIVPALSVAILGTTAVRVPHPEVLPIEWEEVRHMIEEGSLMADGVSTARAMRAYAGVRPLYDLGAEAEGREMSRNFAVIDHEQRDGIAGFASIVGGKVTTYRLMAERVTDLVARRLGVTMPCATAGVPLNDRDDELDQLRHRPAQVGVPKPHGDALARRAARLLGQPAAAGPGHGRPAPRAVQPRPPVDARKIYFPGRPFPSPSGGGPGWGYRES